MDRAGAVDLAPQRPLRAHVTEPDPPLVVAMAPTAGHRLPFAPVDRAHFPGHVSPPPRHMLAGAADERHCETCRLWTSGCGGLTSWLTSCWRSPASYGSSGSMAAARRGRRRSPPPCRLLPMTPPACPPTTSPGGASPRRGGRPCPR